MSLKATAVIKKRRATRIPLQLQDRVQHLLNILTHFDIIAPVNTDSLTTGNTFINPVIILKTGESLKIVLYAPHLITIINEKICSWPIKPIQIILKRIKGLILSIANKISAYNQMPLDKSSQWLTIFVIAGQKTFKRLFYGISFGPADFLSFMSFIFKPLIRKNKNVTFHDDVVIQHITTDTMLQTLDQYHNILKIKISRPLPLNLSFS